MYLAVYVLVIATVTFPFTGMLVERMADDLVYNPSFSGIPGLSNYTSQNATSSFKLIQTQPLEYMMLQLKLSFIVGILAALPIVCYFGFKYLGMLKLGDRFRISKTKLVLVAFIAVFLFLVGCSYSYLLMLPMVYHYLIQNAADSGVVSNWKVSEFINFSMLTTFVFGLVFELPLAMTALARSGIVPVEIFKKYRRHMYVVILIVAALVTSPDVLTQIMVGIPLIIFYELSLFTMRFTVPRPGPAHA